MRPGVEMDNCFMVRWQPLGSPASQQPYREVMLKGDSTKDMNSWLTAIAEESSRTAERPVVDWWSELFGEVTN
jgi:hypothetical protein